MELDSAEEEAGKAMLKEELEEAARLGLTASERLERGRPEHVVVELARETNAELVVLGHTARFVVDHSPNHILLLRERGQASE